jgi:hypothetical protein
MGVKVAFQDDDKNNASGTPVGRAGIIVPQSAVQERAGKYYVFLLLNDVVERRAVAIAGERGKDVLVTSGLASGDKVVINAPAGLEDGTRVRESSG